MAITHSYLGLVIALVIIAVAIYVVDSLVAFPAPIETLFYWAVIIIAFIILIVVILWILDYFGLYKR